MDETLGLLQTQAGVFSSSRTGIFSSCCLALDSSSSFPCPAFRAIAKSNLLWRAGINGDTFVLDLLRFSVSGLILKSLIHLELSFVQGDMYGFIGILRHVDIKFDRHHLLKILFFPVYISDSFIKTHVFTGEMPIEETQSNDYGPDTDSHNSKPYRS
ncbi:hypothetical protein STEG23_008827 [Scotinomys teguina]